MHIMSKKYYVAQGARRKRPANRQKISCRHVLHLKAEDNITRRLKISRTSFFRGKIDNVYKESI